MSKRGQYRLVAEDKFSFFNRFKPLSNNEGAPSNQVILLQISELAQSKYALTANNLSLLEEEFKQLLVTLNDDEYSESYWFYCYYCSLMLQSYYEAYGKKEVAASYEALGARILNYCLGNNFNADPKANKNSLIAYTEQKILSGFKEMIEIPMHTSKVKSWVGFANITRLQLTFSRITLNQMIKYANNNQWLEKVEKLINGHIDSDAIIAKLNSANGVFNILSVGLFASRLMINAGMVLKHTAFPSEREKEVPMIVRFRNEVAKRHCDALNDVVWGTVNTFTNFNLVSAPTANLLMSCFLFFDVSLLVYRKHLAETAYLLKKAQYEQEIKMVVETLQTKVDVNQAASEQEALWEQYNLLTNQLQALNNSWEASCATFNFNITAAILLMSGFSASMLFTAPAAAPVTFFVCTIAIAMYVSADLYGNYREKCLGHEQMEERHALADLPGEQNPLKSNLAKAAKQMQESKGALIGSMAKNTFMPMLFLATISTSLPAALALAGLFVGYETYKGFVAQKPKEDSPDPMVGSGASPQM